MRVLQIVNTLRVTDGGPARNSFELNQSLNAIDGVTAQLLWLRGKYEETTYAADVIAGREVALPLPSRGRLLGRGASVLKLLGSTDVVVMHGFYLPWVPVVGWIARIGRTPFVIMPHGSVSSFESARSRWKKRAFDIVSGLMMGRSFLFVTGSAMEEEELLRVRPTARTTVAGVGARVSAGVEHVAVTEADRELVLISIARIAPKKRVDLMISALAVLRDRGIGARLIVAGEGTVEIKSRLVAQAQTLSVSELVEFVGHVGPVEKSRLYSSADVFLLPSDDENFGIGLAEALVNGVPAVVSDRVAAAGEVSRDAARIVHAPTGESLADEIALLRDPARWNLAHSQAVSSAQRAFGWDDVAGRWQRILTNETTSVGNGS